jgi:hypothetical protein
MASLVCPPLVIAGFSRPNNTNKKIIIIIMGVLLCNRIGLAGRQRERERDEEDPCLDDSSLNFFAYKYSDSNCTWFIN